MSKDAVIEQHQQKKNQAFAALAELRKKDDFNAEDQLKWEELNKAMDDASAAMAARQEELQTVAARELEFQRREAEMKASNKDARIGPDETRRREADPEQSAKQAEQDGIAGGAPRSVRNAQIQPAREGNPLRPRRDAVSLWRSIVLLRWRPRPA
jgi:hypothetical protein